MHLNWTYSNTGGKWVKYSSMGSKLSNEAMYMKYSDNHFEPVICVHPIDDNVCFNVCKLHSSNEQYMCRRESTFTCGRNMQFKE